MNRRAALLGDLSDDLRDFCAACYGAPKSHIIRVALRLFIDRELANMPELRRRFYQERDKRLAATGNNVVALRALAAQEEGK